MHNIFDANLYYMKPNPKFWAQTAEKIVLFSDNNLEDLLVIVPTANHIQILEKNLANINLANKKCGILPDIKTLNHVLEEYNINYTNYNKWCEYLNLYQFFKQNNELWSLTTAKSTAQKWQFIKTMVETCHELTERYLHNVFSIYDNFANITETSKIHIQNELDKYIQLEYTNLSKTFVNNEAEILLNIWQQTINIENAPFYTWNACRNFAEYIIQPINSKNKKIIYIQFDDEDYNIPHILDVFNKYNELARILVIRICLSVDEETHLLENLFPESKINIDKSNNSTNINFNIDYINQDYGLDNLKIIKSDSLAQTSEYILASIIKAFSQGKKDVALIAQDRVAIRAIKSLLQAHSIPMADETGWKMSTSMLASCIHKWVNILQNKKIDLFWIKQFNIFPQDLIETLSKLKIHNTELHSAHSIISNFETNDTNIFFKTINEWQGNYTLERWLDILYAWCKWLKFDVFEHNLDNLFNYINELCSADSRTEYAHEEWIIFLQDIIEQGHIASLYDIAEQKVHIIALNGSRLRTFDAVWFIGVADNQFPSSQEHSLFLNENIRYLLGLETKSSRFSKQSIDLLQLIYMHYGLDNNIEFIYQAYADDGCKQQLSRWIEKLHCFANIKYIENIESYITKNNFNLNDKLQNHSSNLTVKFPCLDSNMMSIDSISTYDIMSLYLCPYKFYLSKIAKLNKPYSIEGSDFSDYGTWVHEVLHKSHLAYNFKSNHNNYEFKFDLQEQTNNVFNANKLDAKAREMQQQWYSQMEKYNSWQQNNIKHGYIWYDAEINLTYKLNLQDTLNSTEISIHSKLDRIDINHEIKQIKIIDYKWKSNTIKNDEIDNIQLLVYRYLYSKNINDELKDYAISASFLYLKGDEIKEVEPFADNNILEENSIKFMDNLKEKINSYEIENMPFIAIPNKSCKFCDFRYMCIYKNDRNTEED